jgi:uncharacterized membrane protein
MFVLCVLYSKDKRQKPGQSGQRSTDKVQREREIPVEARFSAPVQTNGNMVKAYVTVMTQVCLVACRLAPHG